MLPGFFKSQKPTHRSARLGALPLFANLTATELKVVDGLLHERRFLKDEVVFDEGDEGQAIYIIIEGKVLICRQGQPVAGRIDEIGAGTSEIRRMLIGRDLYNETM